MHTCSHSIYDPNWLRWPVATNEKRELKDFYRGLSRTVSSRYPVYSTLPPKHRTIRTLPKVPKRREKWSENTKLRTGKDRLAFFSLPSKSKPKTIKAFIRNSKRPTRVLDLPFFLFDFRFFKPWCRQADLHHDWIVRSNSTCSMYL